MKRCAYGYDGSGYVVGDRVELHPGTDLWMAGARYGDVTFIRSDNVVSVRVDAVRRVIRGPAESFRRVPSAP